MKIVTFVLINQFQKKMDTNDREKKNVEIMWSPDTKKTYSLKCPILSFSRSLSIQPIRSKSNNNEKNIDEIREDNDVYSLYTQEESRKEKKKDQKTREI